VDDEGRVDVDRSGNESVLTAARVLTGTGEVISSGYVHVKDGHIAGVGPVAQAPGDAPATVDLGDVTVMPGLIDCHTQLMAQNALTHANYRVAMVEQRPEIQQMYGLLHAQMCFEMGFTTIRDLGWAGPSGQLTSQMIGVRDAIEKRVVAGPRLVIGGWAVHTGSHLDLGLPGSIERAEGVTADGPYELRAQVRAHMRRGVDMIKTCASGGGGTDHEQPGVLNHTEEELRAIADETHAFGKLCACHCFVPEAQKRALRAGFDTLEHCVWTDDEAIELMLETGTPIVPTLLHRTDRAIDLRATTGTPRFVLEKMKGLQQDCFDTFQRCLAAGVTIAMGTDMGLDPEMGSNAAELELYVQLGMDPHAAIRSATQTAAETIGLGDHTGTLEAGKAADLLVVDGDPVSDITILQDKARIQVVMKDGRMFVDRRPGGHGGVVADPEWAWPRWGE
jgi:imidazolonepropionase-like amidohydrolase